MHKKKSSKIKEILIEHLNSNIKAYIIAFLVFVIGIIVGMALLQHLSEEQKNDMVGYINDTINTLKNNNKIDTMSLLRSSITNNIVLCIVMWFAGSTIIGLPVVYGMVAFKGFSLGYTISAIIAVLGTGNGMIFTITTMLLQNIIFIPCILALTVSATRLCSTIIKDRTKGTIKYGIMKHTVFSIIICFLLILSSFVEVYISTALFNFSLNVY